MTTIEWCGFMLLVMLVPFGVLLVKPLRLLVRPWRLVLFAALTAIAFGVFVTLEASQRGQEAINGVTGCWLLIIVIPGLYTSDYCRDRWAKKKAAKAEAEAARLAAALARPVYRTHASRRLSRVLWGAAALVLTYWHIRASSRPTSNGV
jgi:hypothetical protein